MRAKMFCKIIAGVVTLAMAAQFAFVMPASAATGSFLSTDFEQYSTGEYTWGTSIFTTKSASDLNSSNIAFTGLAATIGSSIEGDAGGNKDDFSYDIVTMNNAIGSTEQAVDISFKLAKRYNGEVHTLTASFNDASGNMIFGIRYGLTGRNGNKLVQLVTNAATENVAELPQYTDNAWTTYDLSVSYASAESGYVSLGSTTLPFNGAAIKSVSLKKTGNTQNRGMVMDDLKIDTKAAEKSYLVTYDVNGTETSEMVKENASPGNVPTASKTGYIFKGWQKDADSENLITDLSTVAITANTKFTAVFEVNPDYVEPLKEVDFVNFPKDGMFVAGPDENTANSNAISVKAVGEIGGDLLTKPDIQVTYTLNGFRWIAAQNRATSDSADSNTYCDGYAALVVDDTAHTADFQLKQVKFNFYGTLTATAEYLGVTKEVTRPVAYLGLTDKPMTQLLPHAGYISNFDYYSDDLVGYKTTDAGTATGNIKDIVTGNWVTFGGNTRELSLKQDEGGKFMHLEALGTTSSTFAVNKIDLETGTQVMFDQKVRFQTSNSTILLKSAAPNAWPAGEATSLTAKFTGSELQINGKKIADAGANIWYRLVIASDVTSGKCYAVAYDADNKELGTSEVADFSDAGSVTPTYYMFSTPDKMRGSLDFNDVKVYRAQMQEDTFKISTGGNDTVTVPETPAEGETVTPSEAALTVAAKTTDGYDMIGKATWSVDNTPAGVAVTADAADSHKAVLKVTDAAAGGKIVVRVAMGGAVTTKEITLSSSKDSVRMDNPATGTASIAIPTSGDTTYKFAGTAVDGDGNALSPAHEVTYELYDKNNAEKVTPAGVTLAADGTMTVTTEAKPCTLYVRMNSTNSATPPEAISASAKVIIHGLDFDFGAGTDEDVADAYTSITPQTFYEDSVGYGITGAPTVAGEGSATDPNADYFEGTFGFKVKVERNKIYKVTTTFKGEVDAERINNDLFGFALTQDDFVEKTENIYVYDDVIDFQMGTWTKKDKQGNIIGTTPLQIASLKIEPVADITTPNPLPHIFSIGDSTIANNNSTTEPKGQSWAYRLNANIAAYPELTEVATFSNNGAGSRNLMSYYSEGKLNSILTAIRPGDYVMIGCMGTNGTGTTHKDNLNYYIDSCKARGAKIILYTYTPHGTAAYYDSATHTFTGLRTDSGDPVLREVAQERADEIAGFIDLGKMAIDSFNAYVQDFAEHKNASGASLYATIDDAANAILACYPDHNHYYLSNLVSDMMLNGYKDVSIGMVQSIIDIVKNSGEDPVPTYAVSGTIDANITAVKLIDTTDSAKVYTGTISGTSVAFSEVPAGAYTVNVTYASGYEANVMTATGLTGTTLTITNADVTDLVITSKQSGEEPPTPVTKLTLEYENGRVKITSPTAQTVTVILASYANGVLTELAAPMTWTLEANTPKEEALELSTGDKLMVWNTVKGMIPLCEAYELPTQP